MADSRGVDSLCPRVALGGSLAGVRLASAAASSAGPAAAVELPIPPPPPPAPFGPSRRALEGVARLGVLGGLSGPERILRAWNLGAQDACLLPLAERSRFANQQRDVLVGQKTAAYAVLFSYRRGPGACLTKSLATYYGLVKPGGTWEAAAISRARAYLLGGGVEPAPLC